MGILPSGPEKRPIFSHIAWCWVTPGIRACEADILQRGRGYPEQISNGRVQLCYACAQACTESLFLPRHTVARI